MRETLTRLFLSIVLAGSLLFSGCTSSPEGGADPPATHDEEAADYLFTDVTDEAGVSFTHFNSATQARLLPETMGSGVAFFDYDNDGFPDIYFVNGAPLVGSTQVSPTGQLYRNRGDGRFEDVTSGSGLDESFFGMGVAVGDFENDGWLDLAVTGTDRLRLYRNLGDGGFLEVTREMGAECPGFGASAAFLDFDRDGFLDLFVGRYVEWTVDSDIPCSPDGVHRTYCTPEVYPGISNVLFRNVDGRRYEDVSARAGIEKLTGKTLGVVAVDYDDDGWSDIAVANDTVGNFLLVNKTDGTFEEIGVDSGMAFSESGAARGGMGIDAGDIDRDGVVDIVIGNFSQEMVAVFRGIEAGYFIDDAAQVGIGIPTLMTLAFGTLVDDFDNNGWLDVLLVNGHIEPDISQTQRAQAYRQPPQFFRNLGEGQFSAPDDDFIGPEQKLLVARGFASADFDRDGDLDFVVTQNGADACLLRNESEGNNWVRLKLRGTDSNRVGYGAKVRVISGETVITRELASGRSYLSSSEPIVHVGLGEIGQIDRIEILWPSGIRQTIENPPLNQLIAVTEAAN